MLARSDFLVAIVGDEKIKQLDIILIKGILCLYFSDSCLQ